MLVLLGFSYADQVAIFAITNTLLTSPGMFEVSVGASALGGLVTLLPKHLVLLPASVALLRDAVGTMIATTHSPQLFPVGRVL